MIQSIDFPPAVYSFSSCEKSSLSSSASSYSQIAGPRTHKALGSKLKLLSLDGWSHGYDELSYGCLAASVLLGLPPRCQCPGLHADMVRPPRHCWGVGPVYGTLLKNSLGLNVQWHVQPVLACCKVKLFNTAAR